MYVTSLPPISNRSDWIQPFEIDDADTDDPIDLSTANIILEVRDQDGITVLSGTTGNGKILIIDTGVFQATFLRTEMTGLSAGLYDIGCTIGLQDSVYQLLIGELPIIDGVVSK